MIAQVAVSCAVYAMDQPYSYRLPPQAEILPGTRVMVPFGRANRRTEAIVLALAPGDGEGLKSIESALDDGPVMDEEQLRLAAFIRERYFCTYYDAVKAILPAGLWFRQEKIYKMLSFAGYEQMHKLTGARDVADPWYTGDFDATYRDVLEGCEGLLAYVREKEKMR